MWKNFVRTFGQQHRGPETLKSTSETSNPQPESSESKARSKSAMADAAKPRTSVQQDLHDRNAFYAENFNGGDLQTPPKRHYAFITCMDSRIDVTAAFGHELGDAHIIRNAGASARGALRSIIVSQQFLGTREIVLVKHTHCGMQTFTNEEARELVQERLGPKAAAEIGTLDFLPFKDLKEAVREDCGFLRKQAAVLPETAISGWVYDVKTGKVEQVV